MKKNKTVAYMLAAMLLVGGTFVGTKAWFTDQATIENDLVITTGTLDISVDDIGWYSTGRDSEIITIDKEGISGNTVFENAKPGDVFTKTINVENTGSLKQKLNVKGGTINKQSGPFLIKSDHTNLDKKIIEPGKNEHINITVEINENWEGQEMKFDLSHYMTNIVIDAEQTPSNAIK